MRARPAGGARVPARSRSPAIGPRLPAAPQPSAARRGQASFPGVGTRGRSYDSANGPRLQRRASRPHRLSARAGETRPRALAARQPRGAADRAPGRSGPLSAARVSGARRPSVLRRAARKRTSAGYGPAPESAPGLRSPPFAPLAGARGSRPASLRAWRRVAGPGPRGRAGLAGQGLHSQEELPPAVARAAAGYRTTPRKGR